MKSFASIIFLQIHITLCMCWRCHCVAFKTHTYTL